MAALTSIELPPHKDGIATIFFKSQFLAKPKWPPVSTNLSGKVAIVTGGGSGIGLHSCQDLLSFKLSHLIIAVRSVQRGKDAASKLRKEYPGAKIDVWELEMGSYASIQAFVNRVHSELKRLDIAILNAGLLKANFQVNSSTGHEEILQVNYLSTMLLATLILPELKNKSPVGAPGRLSIVGSGSVYMAKFANRTQIPLLASFDNETTPWNALIAGERYSCSKLLGQLFLVKIAGYINADDVIVNIVDPGMTKGSGLGRESGGVEKVLGLVMQRLAARTLTAAASTYVDAAVIKGKESHGCFVMDWDIKPFAIWSMRQRAKK